MNSLFQGLCPDDLKSRCKLCVKLWELWLWIGSQIKSAVSSLHPIYFPLGEILDLELFDMFPCYSYNFYVIFHSKEMVNFYTSF